MTHTKSIVLSQGPDEALQSYVASLALPRRAISLSLTPDPPSALPSFIELWGEDCEVRSVVAGWPFPARAWLVAEHVPIAYERSWASGTPSPGVRMVSSLYRRPGWSRGAFEAYWLGPHTEVAASYTVPVWHYNQNVVVEALTEHSGEDGFVGMHFQSVEQLEARWADHPAEAARGAEDAAQFMDVPRSDSIHARETVWERE
jgi:hypothetical protein